MNTPTVILFGGSFNPPHVAHLAVAEAAADSIQNSRVVWMPAATPPHKQDDPDLATAGDRMAMVHVAIQGNDRFEVSDLEIRRGDVSFTVDTLRALKEAQPESELFILLGGDSLAEFITWREPEAILKLARLLVYRRPGVDAGDVPEWVMDRVTFIDAPRLDLSSTELRERIRAGKSVRYLMTEKVLEHVEEQGLYL